jgi:hypothetical protein
MDTDQATVTTVAYLGWLLEIFNQVIAPAVGLLKLTIIV